VTAEEESGVGGGGGIEKEDSGRAGELEESGRDGRKRGREGGRVNERPPGRSCWAPAAQAKIRSFKTRWKVKGRWECTE
jgi:hypothetical protein